MKERTFLGITVAIILSIIPIYLILTNSVSEITKIIYQYIPQLYFKIGIILGFVFIVLVGFEVLTLDTTYFYPLKLPQEVKISGLHKRISSMLRNPNYPELGKILYRNFRRTLTVSLRIKYSSSDEDIITHTIAKFPHVSIDKLSSLLKTANDVFYGRIVIYDENNLIAHHSNIEDFLQRMGVWKYGSV